MKEIFSRIISRRLWKDHVCGTGSTDTYTQSIRNALPNLIKQYSVKTMLDIPCGDFSWMSTVDLGCDYIGADIVDELVDRSRLKHPDRDIRSLDLCHDDLPCVDLVFCRDCLIHLSIEDAKLALSNIQRSGSRYLLTTSYDSVNNKSIRTGEFYPVNLQIDPFGLPAPLEKVIEPLNGKQYRYMGLWPISELKL